MAVSDNGLGVGDSPAARDGYGIGLANVRDRLAARFGEAATIVSGPVPGGYSTQLRMPILDQPDDGDA